MKFPKTALVAGSLLFVLTGRIAAEGQGVLGQGNVSCSSWLENHTSDDARAASLPWGKSGTLMFFASGISAFEPFCVLVPPR
jgi:hypothetical protein